MGKFVMKKVPSGVKFDLKAGNGEIISISEVYTTKVSCRNGIDSVRRNAPIADIEDTTVETIEKKKCPKFQVYKDKKEEFRFRLLATNGQIIASSGEGYTTKAACLNGVDSVKRNAGEAEVVEKED